MRWGENKKIEDLNIKDMNKIIKNEKIQANFLIFYALNHADFQIFKI